MQKPRTYAEVYNDLDDDIVNVFRVLQDRTTSEILTRLLTLTPYARREFELAYEPSLEPVERARRTLVRAAMGFGSSGSTKGSHEMSDAEHEELLNVLLALDGFVIVSGYETDLYDDYLSGWEKHRTQSRISSGRGTSLRTECVWLNPRCADLQRQQRFDWDAEHASHVRQTVR